MTAEEQQQEDERAREAAMRAFATIPDAVSSAEWDAQGAGPITIEASDEPDPQWEGMGAGEITIEPSDEPDPQAESVFGPDYPQEPHVSEAADYGLAGMRQMQHAIDGGGAADLGSPVATQSIPEPARDGAEPLGSVATTGPQRGQMFSPSGARESWEGRYARLGTGGDFATQLPEETPDPTEQATPPDPATMSAKPTGSDGPAPRLDDGLPTEAEIGRARGTDALRRIFYALGSGLMTAGGRTPPSFHSQADELDAQRRQGLREALQRKGVMRGEERAAERQASQDARQSVMDRLAERRVAAAEAMVPDRQALTQAQTEATRARSGLTQAQTEHTQVSTEELRGEVLFNAATREQREDPASTASDGMRRAVRARLAAMGPRGEPVAAQIGDLDSLNANQLHDILPTLMQGVGIRTGAAGGGGATTPTAPGASLAEQYMIHNVPGADTLEHAQAMVAALGGEDDPHAQAVLVSRANEESAATPGPSVQQHIAAVETSLSTLQTALRGYGDDIPGIGLVEGSMPTLLLSQEGREVRAMVRDLADNYLRMVSGAAVPEHEIENLAERLGTYDERQFRAAITRMQRELESRRTGTSARRSATAPSRPTRAAPPSTPSDTGDDVGPDAPTRTAETVTMRRPDGSIARDVPQIYVDRARRAGWELVE